MLRFARGHNRQAPEASNDSLLEDIEWLRRAGPWFDRRGGADHVWIFPSGRGASMFPGWRDHIAAGLFLSPEGDTRTGLIQPGGKDIVIPGYRDISHITNALRLRGPETSSVARPTLIFFRGSTTSSRPGEANYSEGVRQRLASAVHRFVPPPHLSRALRTVPEQDRTIFSTEMVPLTQYLREMSLSDFCLVPMGSSSWTLRLYDALFLGCVPVVLSDHIALPFQERIDWSKLVIKWPQSEAERLPSFLLGVSEKQLQVKRRAILAARHHFAWSCPEGGAFAQLVSSLEARKQALLNAAGEGQGWVSTSVRYLSFSTGVAQHPSAWLAHPPSADGQDRFWVDAPGDVQATFDRTDGCTANSGSTARPTPEHVGGAQYDVVTAFSGKPNCVLRAALRSLEVPLRPRKVHLILDACYGIEAELSMFNVHCVELDSALSVVLDPMKTIRKGMAIPAERAHWLEQQLAKLAVATHAEVSETVYVWDGDTIALGDMLPARMPDGRFPLL